MNDILQLKGAFEQKSSSGRPGAPKLVKTSSVSSMRLMSLIENLKSILDRRDEQSFKLEDVLLSVYYNKIAAKSNRVIALLSPSGKTPNDCIVGAKYSEYDGSRPKHIITYYVPEEAILLTIKNIEKVIGILKNEFDEIASAASFNDQKKIAGINFKQYGIAKTTFQNIIVDASYIDKIDIDVVDIDSDNESIITLYKINDDMKKILEKLNINVTPNRILDGASVLLDAHDIKKLMISAPYLIAMSIPDISTWMPTDFEKNQKVQDIFIPSPTTEPTIGVIDTLFDENVYFNEWVQYNNFLHHEHASCLEDKIHGTSVTSIIVDGPNLNPEMQDNCGRFKVRHFGVASSGKFSSFAIIRDIKTIIAENRDIKVWNLCLGSEREVHRDFISIEASVLDQIQHEYDVIFVVAGTNDKDRSGKRRIGSPADSINALVVNSVDLERKPTDYIRVGPVLSFYTKPDISYYGGTTKHPVFVYGPEGLGRVAGTSYAAPWIARKLSYLIDILGFTKEVAKAMIIHSAIGWNENSLQVKSNIGHGVPPILIDDIVRSSKDEIRFVLTDLSEKYDTYNYNFPVPIYKEEYPFVARATICYFPKCTRNQGVDYTNTELDIYFGRLDNAGKIKSINNNKQSLDEVEVGHTYEEDARKYYGKWDNVKHIQDIVSSRSKGKKVYDSRLWGMSIKTKERLKRRDGEGLRFGIVVSLREINGVNRIEDFIQQCSFKGWLVNKVNIENKLEVYQTASEDIEFDT